MEGLASQTVEGLSEGWMGQGVGQDVWVFFLGEW